MLGSAKNKKRLRREVAQYLREARIRLKLSQSEVARELKITAQYLSNFENGRSPLRNDSVLKLIKIYKIKKDDFVHFYTTLIAGYLLEEIQSFSTQRQRK